MSEDSEGVTRRYMLQTLGAAGAAGLAGCSSGGDNGSTSTPTTEPDTETGTATSTTTSVPEVDHVELSEWPREYLLDAGDNYGMMFFNSWSPQRIKEKTGIVPLDVSYLTVKHDEPYRNVGFDAGDVPETFFQFFDGGDYSTSAKVDQLPGGVEAGDVKQSLKDNGYEKVNQIGDFEVYSKIAANSVHAVAEDRHAIAANMVGAFDVASTDQHRSYLERVLQQKAKGNKVPDEVTELRKALEPKDTFGVLNRKGHDAQMGTDGAVFIPHSNFTEDYQPTHAATSVDVDQGLKYVAWLFEDEDTAGITYGSLKEEEYRNDWENLSRDGRIMKAAGKMDIESSIENGKMADTTGLLVMPEI